MQTDVGEPTDHSAVARSVSRRTVLQFLGLGAGVVAVAGATGLTANVVLVPDPADATHIATVTLTRPHRLGRRCSTPSPPGAPTAGL